MEAKSLEVKVLENTLDIVRHEERMVNIAMALKIESDRTATALKLESDRTAVALKIDGERIAAALKIESERNQKYMEDNSTFHNEMFREIKKLDIRVVLVSTIVAIIAGGGGSIIGKLFG